MDVFWTRLLHWTRTLWWIFHIRSLYAARITLPCSAAARTIAGIIGRRTWIVFEMLCMCCRTSRHKLCSGGRCCWWWSLNGRWRWRSTRLCCTTSRCRRWWRRRSLFVQFGRRRRMTRLIIWIAPVCRWWWRSCALINFGRKVGLIGGRRVAHRFHRIWCTIVGRIRSRVVHLRMHRTWIW